ncbi:MAG: LmbE family N-acetylglucosaminyl deacetylase [Phycisphaerales bacterium]|jgi:LmbE family N-acetylglucosaminyl deacetylase
MARILIAGPHPDDQELGMGGTIIRLASQGHHLLLLDVTNGEPTPLGDPETRKGEAADALVVLRDAAEGFARSNGTEFGSIERCCLGLPNRFVEHTIENRHAIAGAIRAWQAEVLFTPFFEDAHPDHLAVTKIVEDARFDSKLSKVQMPWPVDHWTGEPMPSPVIDGAAVDQANPATLYPRWLFYYYATHLRWVADPSFLIDITGLVDQKIDSINTYHTQFVLPEKNRKVVEWVKAAGTYFGSRIGTDAAEPFFTKEPIGLGSLGSLVNL